MPVVEEAGQAHAGRAFIATTAPRADDPGTCLHCTKGKGGAVFQDWAAGFDALVGAAKRAWPAKALAADDKRVLRSIAAVAEGQDDAALRAVLPHWIARRHGLRE